MTDVVSILQTETLVAQVDATQFVVTQDDAREIIVTGLLGPKGDSGSTELSGLTDIDLTNLTDGSMLVYNNNTTKWAATTTLSKQAIDCGEF